MIKLIRGELPTFEGYEKLKKNLPALLANEIKNHFLEGFRNSGGATDKSVGGWDRRKSGAKRDTGRRILVDTGALRRDIQKKIVTYNKIVVGIKNVSYGIYHNEGTENMPQREFIGQSKKLDKKIIRIIERQLRKL